MIYPTRVPPNKLPLTGCWPAIRSALLKQSFQAHGREVLRLAVLQRFYWANFPAIRGLWSECGLADLRLGGVAEACGWIARHQLAQPPAAAGLAVVRGLRQLVRGRSE
jgi:hypothetical protein